MWVVRTEKVSLLGEVLVPKDEQSKLSITRCAIAEQPRPVDQKSLGLSHFTITAWSMGWDEKPLVPYVR